MCDYFESPRRFVVGSYAVDISPSAYDTTLNQWTPTKVTTSDAISGALMATTDLLPGSDRVKAIVSSDGRHTAVFCESQWYEDLYVLDTHTLRVLASFEGTNHINGASEGIFAGSYFITLPTFSFEGGCGGLRRVVLPSGQVEQVLPPAFFDGLRLWLETAEQPSGHDLTKPVLNLPVGLLGYNYDPQSENLTLDYLPGQVILSIMTPLGVNHFCQYRFIPRDTKLPFRCEDGTLWKIREDEIQSNRWLNRQVLKIDPRVVAGRWSAGWAMDLHTLRSVPAGPDEWGNESFDTTRTEIGEAVYKLKYRADRTQVEPIAQTIADFIRGRQELADLAAVLAVPPSNIHRPFQPVPAIAAAVGTSLNLPVPTDYLLKTKQTTPLKGMSDKQKRHEELEGAFRVADERFAGKHVVLVDDLFRSGETLNAVSAVLLSSGKVDKVSVVTATITRSRK